SLALAPFVRLGHNQLADAQTGSRVLAMGLLVAVFIAAWSLAGPIAAAIAALVSMASPFVEQSARVVLSDAFRAILSLLLVIIFSAVSSPRYGKRARSALYLLAGFVAGYGVLTKLGAILTLGAAIMAAPRWRHARLVAVGALPCLVFLGAYQWTEFGNPLRTGYDYQLPTLTLFELGNVTKEG